MLPTAASLSLPGMGASCGVAWTGMLLSGQGGPSQREVGVVPRCHRAGQGAQASVVALGCTLVLLRPVQLGSPAAFQTLAVLTLEI